jgi:hypothetical protein
MRHVLTLEEIATACSEYVVKRHYPGGAWNAKASVETVAADPTKIPGATWKSDYQEGVITRVSIEVQEAEAKESRK